MNIKCIVVDDEPLAVNILVNYVSQIPEIELVATCADAIEALTFIKKENIDLVLLDINMPKLSGVSLMRALKNPPMVIFTTAYPEFAIEGYELEAIDYLLKPFSFERFQTSIYKVRNKLKLHDGENMTSQEHIYIKSDKKLFRVLFDDIIYLEAYGDYVKVYTKEKMLLTKQKLAILTKELPIKQFIQIHRSYVISIKAIDFIEGNTVLVAGNKLPISVGQKQTVLDAIG
ncbi:MAG: LytTR family DNA-binding domain-containing protein [Saprospiraceae bacterium]